MQRGFAIPRGGGYIQPQNRGLMTWDMSALWPPERRCPAFSQHFADIPWRILVSSDTPEKEE